MRVWLITGAAGGLGRAFAPAALEHGDAVAHHRRALDEWLAHERVARSADQAPGSEASPT